MILLIDNYDSFTWNLYQTMAALGVDVSVHRNDAIDVAAAIAMEPDAVVLSPGPGRPSSSGICPALLRELPEQTPLLGVCLGHQALVEHYGGDLEVDPVPTHGKASLVHHDGDDLFATVPNPFPAGRYHSLRAVRNELPSELQLTAWTAEGVVMAVRHRTLPRYGLQFHPESILTPQGSRIVARFLSMTGAPVETA